MRSPSRRTLRTPWLITGAGLALVVLLTGVATFAYSPDTSSKVTGAFMIATGGWTITRLVVIRVIVDAQGVRAVGFFSTQRVSWDDAEDVGTVESYDHVIPVVSPTIARRDGEALDLVQLAAYRVRKTLPARITRQLAVLRSSFQAAMADRSSVRPTTDGNP